MSDDADRVHVGTVEDLHASASRAVGLEDFGDGTDAHREALGVLLDSLHTDAGLTPAGSKYWRSVLKSALTARLMANAGFAAAPKQVGVEIERPVVVTGLPRTGTTALHRLLGADPANQGLELWLTEVPQPRPPRESWEDDPAYVGLRDLYAGFMSENPDYGGVHYISADDLEECWQLLRQSVTSASYECLARLDGYSSWLQGADWAPAYRRHKRNLQLIGANDPGRRWVLKNPSHLFTLDALLEVYPDAVVVQTHRDPRKSMASMCSLAHRTAADWSTRFTPEYIGESQLEMWARGVETFDAVRARHEADPASRATFVDVEHRELVGDPAGVVERVYAAAGETLDDDVRAAVEAENARSLSGDRAPAHTYTLADYGLSEEQIAERFAGYRGLDT
ncbi:sulfotransferase [Dietzia aurantiaca]|uniref:sulfotransferase family protein n=1 Tax=Dietzia aurantiaca TaxID=983873 RepID=UPI001E54AD0C|nr:sulfotransferase [Dietzia aurantiaca]MCD2263948.1 sulfotransferase [Dietzia aurantiaca]